MRPVFMLILLVSSVYESLSCFTFNSETNVSLATGSSFYQECHCSSKDSIEMLKWIGPNGDDIAELRPDTKVGVYIEKKPTSLNILIPSFSKAISGQYKCQTNHNGKTFESIYYIEAYDPVYFIETEERQYLIKGQNSKIICKVSSDEDVLITWYKGQDLLFSITDDDRNQIVKDGLEIQQVTNDDRGVYKCTADVLSTGEKVEKLIDVQVLTRPAVESIEMTPNTTLQVGSPLALECKGSGIPYPKFKWRKQGAHDEEWFNDTENINFVSLKASDEGMYHCLATNDAGIAEKSIFVEVCIPPAIEDFKEVTVAEGSHAQIICVASGRPTPEVNLVFFDGDNKDDNNTRTERVMISETQSRIVVTIYKIDTSFDGRYMCNATNKVGKANKTTHLSVYYKPKFSAKEEKIWGWSDKSVTLNCSCDSNPPATYKWIYRKSASDPQAKTLSVNERTSELFLQHNDSLYGVYECVAKNNLGEEMKILHYKEGFVPTSNINVTVIDKTKTSIIFSIDYASEVEMPPLIGFTAEYDESSNYEITNIHMNRTWSVVRPYKIDNLKPMTNYSFRFAAINEVGVGGWSQLLDVIMPEKSVPKQPEWVETTVQNESRTIQWYNMRHKEDFVDFYVLKYTEIESHDNNTRTWKQRILNPEVNESSIPSIMKQNTTYLVQLIAHNSEGYSLPAELILNKSHNIVMLAEVMSSEMIVGLVAIFTVLGILALDGFLFLWKRKGMIASCYYRNARKRRLNKSRERKGLLRDNESAAGTLKPKSNDSKLYNENRGVITGKHSAV